MPRLPRISGAEAIRALEKPGFVVVRQRGSHVVWRRGTAGCVVPDHRELKIETLSGILEQANVTVEALVEAPR